MIPLVRRRGEFRSKFICIVGIEEFIRDNKSHKILILNENTFIDILDIRIERYLHESIGESFRFTSLNLWSSNEFSLFNIIFVMLIFKSISFCPRIQSSSSSFTFVLAIFSYVLWECYVFYATNDCGSTGGWWLSVAFGVCLAMLVFAYDISLLP